VTSTHYPTVLFDWGDTVMKDDLASSVPMVEWDTVQVVPGIEAVLAYLHSRGRLIALATSASISNEDQIRGALARAEFDRYFSHIFCFKNTGLPKGEAFYRYILNKLAIPASDALMVGDGFEKDVLDANKVGMYAVWFNSRSDEAKSSGTHVTVHTMEELLAFFELLDQ
jgi:FMN phosphatase YigB (HAD superfamily)